MIGLIALFIAGGIPVGYSNEPNDGISQCQEIDDRYGDLLVDRRDKHERSKIYFQLNQWVCEDSALFESRWYSSALETMGEPSFAFKPNAKGYSDRVRLLIFSHTGPGYVLRVDLHEDGRATLDIAENEWAAVDDERRPKRLKRRISREIDPQASRKFLERLQRTDLLQSRFHPHESEQKRDEDHESYDVICIDMRTAVFERLANDGVHTVAQTGCGRPDEIEDLIEDFHKLAGVKLFSLEPVD